ncbi:MAG: hypothetical protein WCJ09_11125 [Planctomycetota bacterium]
MTRQGWIAALVLAVGLTALGVGLLPADEPVIPRQQRVSPKVLKEAMLERPVISAAAVPHSMGRNVQDLRAIADDLEKGGHRAEANRLNGIIREIVRHVEHELADKKAQIARLNAEIDDLKTMSESDRVRQ